MVPVEVPVADFMGVASTALGDAAASFTNTATAAAPSCPGALTPLAVADAAVPALATGQIIDDYQVLRLLGSGAFARVYLARQLSLDRLVALKVSPNEGSEARTLARLEHQHIVQVFAEIVDPAKNLRLLSMQLVPGVTLARLAAALSGQPAWTGHTFLALLDERCTETTAFDLGSVAIRTFVETCDRVALICWLGARLAEALAHAHSQGVIHRDVKPANILINRYGRPLLADFNIAVSRLSGPDSAGGTLAYMSPEQLDAFLPGATGEPPVAERSDVYSLALVLFELLTGRLPFVGPVERGRPTEYLLALSEARHAGAPSPRALAPETPPLLDRLLRRCLDPQPESRLSAAQFMYALDACRELLDVDRQAGGDGRLLCICRSRPFTLLFVLALLPHVVATAVNIGYNQLLIVNKDPLQKDSFYRLVVAYNAVIYPVLGLVGIAATRRVWQLWQRLCAQPDFPAADAAALRRQALRLVGWIVVLSALGWFPGAVVFPAGLNVPLDDAVHFFFSFLISGLIASTYAYLAVQYVVLRVLYPQMWSDPSAARHQAHEELAGVAGRLRLAQFMAVLIPLLGAALLIGAGPDQLSLSFRLLLTSLMVLGIAGFALATRVCNRLARLLTLLTP